MALPSILRIRKRNTGGGPSGSASPTSPSTAHSNTEKFPSSDGPTTADIKQATRLRRNFALSASFSYLISFIFLILVLVGNTSNKPVLNDIYFFKLDLADIIPMSVPNASLINSIAQSIGLHDFYQVGLWNFCEGYINDGITFCSAPQTLYWFNPVEILMNELLAGATIALPTAVITILDVLRITSQIMFGFFLTGCVLSFLLIFLNPVALYSRWWSLPLGIVAFFNCALVGSASIVGTAISIAFKYAAEAQSELNIHARVGVKMFVFMWIASAFAMWGFVVNAGMGCCCASRRDVRMGTQRRGVTAWTRGDSFQSSSQGSSNGSGNGPRQDQGQGEEGREKRSGASSLPPAYDAGEQHQSGGMMAGGNMR